MAMNEEFMIYDLRFKISEAFPTGAEWAKAAFKSSRISQKS